MTEGESTATAVQELEPTPVAKPDQAAYDAQLAELNSEIEELTKRRERFGDKIEKAKSGSQEINVSVHRVAEVKLHTPACTWFATAMLFADGAHTSSQIRFNIAGAGQGSARQIQCSQVS